MFITFEGIDGCGKSTQIKLLADYFNHLGKDVLILREPGGTPLAESIRKILLFSKDFISPISELLLFEAARASLVETVIKPGIENNKIILCDRFYDSTTAYQGYGRLLPLDFVKNCNIEATGGLSPDITFYLKLPLDVAHERSNHRKQDRMESSGNDFFERVALGFSEIAQEEPERVFEIDAMGNILETHNLILYKLNELLKIK